MGTDRLRDARSTGGGAPTAVRKREGHTAEVESSGTRDRDSHGTVRNARPRDQLGRPLPYGSVGVPRQKEGIRRTPAETVREAQRLLDTGFPFHAHEVFEDAWKLTTGEHRELWKALAQFAVGVTHLARGNERGAAALLRRSSEALRRLRDDQPYGIDVIGLCDWSNGVLAALPEHPRGTPVPPPPRLLADDRPRRPPQIS